MKPPTPNAATVASMPAIRSSATSAPMARPTARVASRAIIAATVYRSGADFMRFPYRGFTPMAFPSKDQNRRFGPAERIVGPWTASHAPSDKPAALSRNRRPPFFFRVFNGDRPLCPYPLPHLMGEVPGGRRGTASIEAPAHIRINADHYHCKDMTSSTDLDRG